MRRFVLLVLPLLSGGATLLLSGCATGPSLQTRMTAYIGMPEQNLVQALGVPDKQITVNGVSYLAYIRSEAQVEPNGAGLSYGYWGGPFWGPYYGSFIDTSLPQPLHVWSCETTFTVHDGRVADVAFKGNDCS